MSIKILFVDDEQDIIDGYKRMLFSMRKDWIQFYAICADTALKILETESIDVIISDMRMPGMDGSELLAKVKEMYPNVLRIILSGHQNNISIIRSTSTAHQFLLKPCDTQQLKQVITNAFALRQYIEDSNLLKIVNGIGQLPSLPEQYLKLEQEMNNPDVSFTKIKDIISSDPALTAKILQTVNSGFFGLPRRVTDLLQALSYLGVNIIKSVVLYLHTYSNPSLPKNFFKYYEQIGSHSLKVAQYATIIARYEKKDKLFIDDLYVCGILHDIGKLVLIQVPDYYNNLLSMEKEKNISEYEAEFDILGVSHEAIGAYLLGIWGLPKTIIEALAFHHKPEKLAYTDFSIVHALNFANIFATSNLNTYNESQYNINYDYYKSINLYHKIPIWWNAIKDKLE